jgi:hypothetical protein
VNLCIFLETKKITIEELNDLLLTQYCSGDKLQKNDMGVACSACGGEERRIQGFGGETCGKGTTCETQT